MDDLADRVVELEEMVRQLEAELALALKSAAHWRNACRNVATYKKAARQNVEVCRRQGVTLGRTLANAAYNMEREAREVAEIRLAALEKSHKLMPDQPKRRRP
jgi:hypothetical protein